MSRQEYERMDRDHYEVYATIFDESDVRHTIETGADSLEDASDKLGKIIFKILKQKKD